MADETTDGAASRGGDELKRTLSAAAERRSQSLASGVSKEEADAALRNEVGTLSDSCQDGCMDAWMACVIAERPIRECDAEFDACIIACDDTPAPVDPPSS
ncbi:MAG TPA: hypothetical protein VM490_20425 [Armatimonadaceae bacterium]|jgi:hypothetical protein|nr:hypothetical protein [Armatimonadaceae bacterium]